MKSIKKERLLEEYLAKPIEAGEDVLVRGLDTRDTSRFNMTTVHEVFDDGRISIKQHNHSTPSIIEKEDWKKATYLIGTDPFPKRRDRVQNINFVLDSILFKLGLSDDSREEKYDVKGIKVENCNFNPFIYHNGKKAYYQRPLVWTLEDKQTLLDSIYNNIDCGKILIRMRSWAELEDLVQRGETRLFWHDVIDGKQRLSTMSEFLKDGFPDSYGNYYSDLSEKAQKQLISHQLFSYSELPENSKDEDVIEQLLKLNFCGVPQSKEHIEFVKSLAK